jgi:multidrug/hemolysin transport system ATP-binding protein
MSKVIEINGLTKKYGDFVAVDQISFQVEESSLFAFLGPNGAGKSTTINMICTLLEKTAGEVRVGGHLLDRENDSIRNQIGVVFQDSLLDDLLTVKENISVRAGFYGIHQDEFKVRFDEIARILGLEEYANKKYGKLSGGQRRRADIARALINVPKILILDEPTTGLDPQTRLQVWETVRHLQKEKKMTVFLTTHYMEEAALADDVAIIDHGKIVASGTPTELRAKYSNDHLRMIGKEESVLISYLEANNIPFKRRTGYLEVPVKNSMQALELLKKAEELILNFEVIGGTMDDVFINITGREIREGGEQV